MSSVGSSDAYDGAAMRSSGSPDAAKWRAGRAPRIYDIYSSLRFITPYLSCREALAFFESDVRLRLLAERVTAPIDLWSAPHSGAYLALLLRSFAAVDGAVRVARAEDAAAVGARLHDGALRHLACTSTTAADGAEDWLPARARPFLRTVHLGAVVGRDLAALADCPELRCFTARRVHAPSPGALDLRPLASCRHLVRLTISYASYETRGGAAADDALDLSPLSACAGLERLSVPGCARLRIDPAPLLGLPLVRLEYVSESNAFATEAPPTLKVLGFRGAAFSEPTGAGATLERCVALERCAFVECKFEAGLGRALPCLPALRRLTIEGCSNVRDLGALALCPNLEDLTLDLRLEPLNRPSLAPLAGCDALRILSIRSTRFSVLTLFQPPPAFRSLEVLSVSALSYTAFANAAAKTLAFPNLLEFNGSCAVEVRKLESAHVVGHNREYRAAYVRRRDAGCSPKDAMEEATGEVGALVVLNCTPRAREVHCDPNWTPLPALPRF